MSTLADDRAEVIAARAAEQKARDRLVRARLRANRHEVERVIHDTAPAYEKCPHALGMGDEHDYLACADEPCGAGQ